MYKDCVTVSFQVIRLKESSCCWIYDACEVQDIMECCVQGSYSMR